MTKQKNNKALLLRVKFFAITKGIVLFSIITMSLWHIFLDEKSPEMISHSKTYTPIIKARNEGANLLLDKLKSGEISKEDYISSYETVMYKAKKDLAYYNKKKYNLAHEFSFNGRSSLSFWIFVFGMSFSFFILSLRYSYYSIKKSTEALKKSAVFESCAWISVSFFWVLHALFAKTSDFGSTTYLLLGMLISAFTSLAIVYYIKYAVTKKLKVYSVISNLISLIADLKVNHYFKYASQVRNENNKEFINKDVKLVESKILNSLKQVDELT